MEIRTIVINFAIVGLFAFLLIAYAVNVSIDNNSNSSILQNKIINTTFSNLNTSLSSAGTNADKIKQSFENGAKNPFTAFGLIVINTIPFIGTQLTSYTMAFYNSTIGLVLNSIFGGDSILSGIVFSVILFGLIITIILLLWRLFRNAN